MRVSAERSDPGYRNYLVLGRGVKVTLDGNVLANVVTADDELGEVTILDTKAEENWRVIKLQGKVEIFVA